MPRYVFHNPTPCRIYIPGANVWIAPKKNLTLDLQMAGLLDNPSLNALIRGGHLRMQETVESPLISDRIETVVVDMLDGGGGGTGGGWDRIGVTLLKIGPREYRTPEPFEHTFGELDIEVFHQGGRRLKQSPTNNPCDGDYIVEESGGAGTGYDTVRMLSFTPKGLSANYRAS